MGRVLVISDVHGNLPALNAVLEATRGWDDIVVLGDLVDYGPWPGEVIDTLLGYDARIIKGNHDHAVAYGVDCRCGEETHWLSTWFRQNITLELLDRRHIEILKSLPATLEINAGSRALLVHGSPSNPLYGYIHPWLDDDTICNMLSRPGLRLGGEQAGKPARRECTGGLYIVGHTHHQFYRVARGSTVANPGSVGQPRDGDPRAAYMILDQDTGRMTLGRVKYDTSLVVKRLQELGIPEPYMSALRYMLTRARVPPRPSV